MVSEGLSPWYENDILIRANRLTGDFLIICLHSNKGFQWTLYIYFKEVNPKQKLQVLCWASGEG